MTDFDALYRAYAGRVHRFVLSLSGDRATADDVTAETFLRVWTARDRLDLTTVIGYLLTIARRLYLETAARGRRAGPLDVEPASTAPSPSDVAVDRAELAAVRRDLLTLPEPDRAALLMRAEDDLPYDDIAAALGLTVGAAKVKVHRARQRLAALRIARTRGVS